jgi:hypothetical protein
MNPNNPFYHRGPIHDALFFVWSVLIVRQRADEWLAVMIAIALLCIGLTEPAIDGALIAVQPFWYEPLEVMQAFGLLIAFALAFLAFPDGRFTPRWTRTGFVFAASLMTAWVIFPELPFNPTNGASFERTPLASTLFTGALISAEVQPCQVSLAVICGVIRQGIQPAFTPAGIPLIDGAD